MESFVMWFYGVAIKVRESSLNFKINLVWRTDFHDYTEPDEINSGHSLRDSRVWLGTGSCLPEEQLITG
jgi:hypothetical protein